MPERARHGQDRILELQLNSKTFWLEVLGNLYVPRHVGRMELPEYEVKVKHMSRNLRCGVFWLSVAHW